MVKNNNAKHRLSRCSDCELNKQLTADKDIQRSQGFWCITQQELFLQGSIRTPGRLVRACRLRNEDAQQRPRCLPATAL